MKLYIERRDGMIRVRQKANIPLPDKRKIFRTLRLVTDTPENYKNLLRWADSLAHTIEEE